MIFFKAEANNLIGGGHLYRSLSLAKECEEAGEKIEFIFSDSPENEINKVKQAGYKIHVINKTQQYNPTEYLKIIPANNALIVFDTDDPTYYAGELVDRLRQNKIKTACFTITDTHPVHTDLLINPNIIAQKHRYQTHINTQKLIGPQYFVLNKNFRQLSPCTFKHLNYPLTLLLAFGNADSAHLTSYILSAIEYLNVFLKKVIVIIGNLNPDVEKIKTQIDSIKSIPIEYHINTPQIKHLYQQCDTAISSAGMTMWEMALFCIPQMIIASSSRELAYTNYLHELNYIYKLSDYQNLPPAHQLIEKAKKNLENEELQNLNVNEFNRTINPHGIRLIVDNFKKILKSN